MYELIYELMILIGLSEKLTSFISYVIFIGIIIIICFLIQYITKFILHKTLIKIAKKTKQKWDEILFNEKFVNTTIKIVPGIIVFGFANSFGDYREIIQRIASAYIIFITLFIISVVFDTIGNLYLYYSKNKNISIKGYIQIFKIIVFSLGVISIIGTLLDKPFGLLISGIGALTAVLLIVFRDTLLGLVASVQITTNNLVKIGDWIEMPKFGADGDVIDISLHTVKVRNWDMTITTVPTYTLISESFKNWQGMFEAKGRRISRSIFIDLNSIKFADEKLLEKFKRIEKLKDYLEKKEKEIEKYNKDKPKDDAYVLNARKLTNIGTFREYCMQYLKNHPGIDKTKIIMVRQLQSVESGLPLQIYAFTNNTAWVNYEAIQSDIFDHIFSIVDYFELRVYQKPSGKDIKEMIQEQKK